MPFFGGGATVTPLTRAGSTIDFDEPGSSGVCVSQSESDSSSDESSVSLESEESLKN